jgi:hypothetical protein
MPLDHYVSQVHLKNFYSPVLGNWLYAVRKSDLKKFTPRSDDVCRIEDGSTNGYLREDRVVEEFLHTIEPKYNAALAKLRDGDPDEQSVYVIAGFVAYVASCAPAAMRIGTPQLDSVLRSTAETLDRQGILPPAPEALGNKSITELLDDGTVHFDVDGKYPQALGISTIIGKLSLFGNSPWEILHNDDASPFFTSDFPVAIEARGNTGIMNRIVPLAPDLAVRILPDVDLSRAEPDLSFTKFRFRRRRLDHADVSVLNRLIVQCAEDAVFYRDDRAWIEDFVGKNRNYRIDCLITRIPYGAGTMHLASQRICRTEQAA